MATTALWEPGPLFPIYLMVIYPAAGLGVVLGRRDEQFTKIDAMLQDSKEDLASRDVKKTKPHEIHTEGHLIRDPIADPIEFGDFAKVDLRVARILEAVAVAGSDKLIRFHLDLGGETRTVFAGIRSAYDPKDLEGRLTIMVANLAPRKMRFGLSEGMILAAGPGGQNIFLLAPDAGAEPGMKVK